MEKTVTGRENGPYGGGTRQKSNGRLAARDRRVMPTIMTSSLGCNDVV